MPICPHCQAEHSDEGEVYCGNDCEISALREINADLLEILEEVEVVFRHYRKANLVNDVPSIHAAINTAIAKAKGERNL